MDKKEEYIINIEKEEFDSLIKNGEYEKIIEKLNLKTQKDGSEDWGFGFYNLAKLFSQTEKTMFDTNKTARTIKTLKIEKDPDLAIVLFWRSAFSGFFPAIKKLELYYYTNQDGKKDDKKLLTLYDYGCKIGDAYCQYKMGLVYLNGNSLVQKDYKKAHDYFVQAIKSSSFFGAYELGMIYKYGYAPYKKDFQLAFHYFLRGALDNDKLCCLQCGNILSSKNLAKMYGTKKDSELAKVFLKNFLKQVSIDGKPYYPDKRQVLISKYAKCLCEAKKDEEKISGVKLFARKAKNGYSPAKQYLKNYFDFDVTKENNFNIPQLVGER